MSISDSTEFFYMNVNTFLFLAKIYEEFTYIYMHIYNIICLMQENGSFMNSSNDIL